MPAVAETLASRIRSDQTVPAKDGRAQRITLPRGQRNLLLLLVAAAVVFIAGCELLEPVTPTPVPTATPEPTPTPAPTPTATLTLSRRSPPLVPSPTPIPGMSVYHNITAFSLQYPSQWSYYGPGRGILVLGEVDGSLANEPGPSFVIFRKELLGHDEETASDVLENYLKRGPLGDGYLQIGEMAPVTIGGLDGMEALVEEPKDEQRPLMLRAYIAAIVTSQRVGYIFTASSPQSMWDDDWPTLREIRDSITIPEHLK